jgi:hypothetical protein
MLVDINEETVKGYQEARLREQTAPKSINEEIGFLLRIMDVPGDVLRVRLRKKKFLKLKTGAHIGNAFGPEEKARLIENAKQARSPHIDRTDSGRPHYGRRNAELRHQRSRNRPGRHPGARKRRAVRVSSYFDGVDFYYRFLKAMTAGD